MARILVVDDDRAVLEFIKDILLKYSKNLYNSEWDLKVDTLNNAVDALGIIKENNYELIITDIMMARMDGWELIRELRKKFPMFKIPIVVISGVSGVDLEYEGAVHGVSKWFTKPLASKEFAKEIFELIGNQ